MPKILPGAFHKSVKNALQSLGVFPLASHCPLTDRGISRHLTSLSRQNTAGCGNEPTLGNRDLTGSRARCVIGGEDDFDAVSICVDRFGQTDIADRLFRCSRWRRGCHLAAIRRNLTGCGSMQCGLMDGCRLGSSCGRRWHNHFRYECFYLRIVGRKSYHFLVRWWRFQS